jgi:peptidoglycan/LPS O-acetylase OafA/YrhL
VPLHILARADTAWWPAPTFVLPGMPLVFFVSGAIAGTTLSAENSSRPTPRSYWRRTFRRLLVPYWAAYVAMSVIAVIGDLTHRSAEWTVRYPALLWGATGLVVPKPSPAISRYIGHSWFMSVFLMLALAVPMLVRWYERSRWSLFTTLLMIFAAVQTAEFGFGVWVPNELDALSMFALFYCGGFLYSDGTLQRQSSESLLIAGGIAAVCAALYHQVEPGSVNASEPKHLFVGAAGLFVALAFAPALRHVGVRWARGIDRITRRTFTIYLWGWPTCLIGEQIARRIAPDGFEYRAVLAVTALGLLAVAVRVFGGVEDWTAARARAGIGAPGSQALRSVRDRSQGL